MLRKNVVRKFSFLLVFGILALFGTLVVSPFRLTFGSNTAPNEMLTHADAGAPLWISVWGKDATAARQRAAVLFIHGLTRSGPQESRDAALCEALARHGLIVAAPWLRGYDSEKALPLGDKFVAQRWDPLPDITAAFAFLQKDPRVDRKNVFVIGHSLGGGYALLFGLQEPRVAGIVSFSRLDMESRLRSWPGYFDNFRLELSKGFGLEIPMSVEAFQEFANSQIFAFEIVEKMLARRVHPRILFAIGGEERRSDRQWLAAYSKKATGLSEYYEFPGVTHSLNFRGLKGSLWVYNRHTIEQVASTLVRWMRGESIRAHT